MAAPARDWIPEARERTFDMRSLRRLAVWGGSASLALLVAVIAGYSDAGSRRATAQKLAETPSRVAEIDAETRRLADTVRVLAAERERLAARIDSLERNVEDMTGSTKRQSEKPSAGGTSSPAAGTAASVPAREGAAAAEPSTAPAPARQPAGGAEPQTAARNPGAGDEPPKAELGIDVGGAANFGALRVLWTSTKGGNPALFEGLYPLVAVRENGRTKAAELRLVVGPLADVEAATRLCAALSATHRSCRPVAFEGQRLADADAVPERKPSPAPERKPAPPPPPQPSSSFPRLFR